MTPPKCSLLAEFARDGHRAVILRKGPKEWVRMILWDTAHDRFTMGQWFRGSVRSLALSPRGDLAVYHAVKHSPAAKRSTVGTSWTAVSAPPAFEALHLWPVSTWLERAGGGVFEDDCTVVLHHHENDLPPSGARVGDLRIVHGNWIHSAELPEHSSPWTPAPSHDSNGESRRSIWPSPGTGRRGARSCPAGVSLVRVESTLANGAIDRRYLLQRQRGELSLQGVDFAAFDARGRLIVARGGALIHAVVEEDHIEESALADFTDQMPDPRPWST